MRNLQELSQSRITSEPYNRPSVVKSPESPTPVEGELSDSFRRHHNVVEEQRSTTLAICVNEEESVLLINADAGTNLCCRQGA